MAREMTPQERAAQLYGSLTCTTYREGYQDPDNDIALIADVLQDTRRAALLGAVKVAITYGGRARDEDLSGSYTSELIVQALDRLAQEGASSIDLSPTIKDDGGYGEHF